MKFLEIMSRAHLLATEEQVLPFLAQKYLK